MHDDLQLLLRPALLGRTPDWPAGAIDVREFLAHARAHGVDALLHWHASACPWPRAVLEPLRAAALGQAIWELRHQQVLLEVLDALDLAGARPLLLKGSALAYSEYAEPSLRARGDTDVFISATARDIACRSLTDIGFVRQGQIGGERVMSQSSFMLRAADGTEHTIDLHWKAGNEPTVARLFSHDELLASSVPCEPLGRHARIPSRTLSLLFACVHRAKHKLGDYHVDGHVHDEPDRLIWLYDIHLLAEALTPDQWNEIVALARGKGLCGIALEGLERAREAFGTALPADALAGMRHAGHHESASRYFARGPLGRAWIDWWTLPREERWPWLRETFFPPPEQIRARTASRAPLPWLYTRRAVQGLAKRLAARIR